jgi:hypothetical protein
MMTRRVHKICAATSAYDSRQDLEGKLNRDLAPAERIVGTHYVDGWWWIITESYGLGPRQQKGK